MNFSSRSWRMVAMFSLFCTDPIFHSCYRRNTYHQDVDYLLFPSSESCTSSSWNYEPKDAAYALLAYDSLVRTYSTKSQRQRHKSKASSEPPPENRVHFYDRKMHFHSQRGRHQRTGQASRIPGNGRTASRRILVCLLLLLYLTIIIYFTITQVIIELLYHIWD